MSNLNNISLIIQARTGSARLPSKMLLPFYNQKTILDLVIKKLLDKFNSNQIILATTTNENDSLLVDLAKNRNILWFRGDENNVLKRFIDCANKNNANNIIRICADNPFLDIDLLVELIENINLKKIDYASYSVNKTPSIRTHFGFFAEYVSLEALKKIQNSTTEIYYLEHVTNFIYSNPALFKIQWIEVPELISKNIGVRLTVDTIEDFENCRQIYEELVNKSTLNYFNVINYINLRPTLKNQMIHQIKVNEK